MNKELEQQADHIAAIREALEDARIVVGNTHLINVALSSLESLEAHSKPIQGEVDRWTPDEKFIDAIMLHVQVAVSEYDPFPEPVDERDFLANIRGNLRIEFGLELPPNGEKVYWTTPPTPMNPTLFEDD